MSTASIVAIKNNPKEGSGWVKAEPNRLVTRITRVIERSKEDGALVVKAPSGLEPS